MRTYRLFISTGEVSGDLQGALLITALKRQAENLGFELEIVATGGERMAQAGATLLANTSAIGSIGILESLPYVLPTIWLQRQVKRALKAHPPDLVVMIDYLGPNIGIGKFFRSYNPQVPLIYYIAPQEWVWSFGPRNTQRIVEMTDRLLAIFPAEEQYYKQWGANTAYVGHPLIDRAESFPTRDEARRSLGIAPDQQAIALIPASRPQELHTLMPVMFESAQILQAKFPDLHFWIPLSLEQYRGAVERAIQHYGLQATLVVEQPQRAIAAADLAITKSGTVNLELALMNVPQVVLYRVNSITAWVAEHLLNFSIPFMAPPNLALMEPIVPEFLQYHATPTNITQASLNLLLNPIAREQMLADYARMRQTLGEPGVCDRAAKAILSLLPGN